MEEDKQQAPNTMFPQKPQTQADNNLFKQPTKSYYRLLKMMTALKQSPQDFVDIARRLKEGPGIKKEAYARAGMLETEPPNKTFPQSPETVSLLDMIRKLKDE